VTVTGFVIVAVRPNASPTVSLTTHVPAFAKTCVGFAVVDVAPSPKSHAHVVTLGLDGVGSKSTGLPLLGLVGEKVKSAEIVVGVTVTVFDVVAD
jgi:hypothetical protein